jgi:oxaloacetate decarboxylase (Na+ extruding) subunit gamma
MQPLNEAVSIMIVGMVTVMFILFSIVMIGNVIIKLTNKYIPEVVPVVKKNPDEPAANTRQAITAAVNLVTKGKGKVTSITKLKA